MTARVLQFVSRAEQVRLRGMENYARWNRIIKGLEPYGPRERHRIFRQHDENERKDREWAMRHAPIPSGARVLVFSRELAALDGLSDAPRL